MKKFLRVFALILAVLMIVPTIVACGGGNNNEEGNDTTAATQQAEDKKLPDLDWEGQEYRILAQDGFFEVSRDELPEDVVGKAVYERNQELYNKYGITVVGTFTTGYSSPQAKIALESGEDLYDMLILEPEAHHPLASSGYLLDMNSLDYVNMEHEGWIDYNNEQLTMGGRLFYTSNKFLLWDKHRSFILFYNRDMAKELNLGYMEELVFNGEWTIDKVIEMSRLVTADTDGQPGMTKEDTWGAGAVEHYSFAQWAYGAGFRFTEMGSDGYPVLTGATDRIIQILDKVYSLTGNTDVYYCDQDFVARLDYEDSIETSYYDGRVLVCCIPLSVLENVPSKVDFSFGVLPNPKFDTSQDRYYALPNFGNGSLFSVPATVMDTAFTGFGLEALTEASVDTSYKAYIETKSQLQDASDEDCAKCLEIIFNGIVYDIAFISDIGGLGTLMSVQLGATHTNAYARLYKSLEKVASKSIEKVKSDYAAIG